jgi:hypothetical protein
MGNTGTWAGGKLSRVFSFSAKWGCRRRGWTSAAGHNALAEHNGRGRDPASGGAVRAVASQGWSRASTGDRCCLNKFGGGGLAGMSMVLVGNRVLFKKSQEAKGL